MDSVEVAIQVVMIFVLMLSITWASFLAWVLFEERWKRERKEKLVEMVLLPLLDEVEGNLGRINRYGVVYDESGSSHVVVRKVWERVKVGLLWDALSPHGVKDLAEGVYDGMSELESGRWRSMQEFDSVVIGVLEEFIVKKGVSLDQVEVGKVKDAIRFHVSTLRNMGFDLFVEDGWDTFKDNYYEDVSKFIRDSGREHSDVCEVSASAEDVFGVIRRRFDALDDSEIKWYQFQRESLLKDGGKLAHELIYWKNKELKYLMGKEWSEARGTYSMLGK